MKLSELSYGSSARVVSVDGEERITKRLMEMGVIPGIDVTVIRSAPFGGPLQIRLLGYKLAIRRNEAETIEIETPSDTQEND
ncbi:MAG: ferrous iron transport protein A [Acidobacteria bacterium]|nr:ferrous iron transport protein A [Acidobacteriota bacterium]